MFASSGLAYLPSWSRAAAALMRFAAFARPGACFGASPQMRDGMRGRAEVIRWEEVHGQGEDERRGASARRRGAGLRACWAGGVQRRECKGLPGERQGAARGRAQRRGGLRLPERGNGQVLRLGDRYCRGDGCAHGLRLRGVRDRDARYPQGHAGERRSRLHGGLLFHCRVAREELRFLAVLLHGRLHRDGGEELARVEHRRPQGAHVRHHGGDEHRPAAGAQADGVRLHVGRGAGADRGPLDDPFR